VLASHSRDVGRALYVAQRVVSALEAKRGLSDVVTEVDALRQPLIRQGVVSRLRIPELVERVIDAVALAARKAPERSAEAYQKGVPALPRGDQRVGGMPMELGEIAVPVSIHRELEADGIGRRLLAPGGGIEGLLELDAGIERTAAAAPRLGTLGD